MANLEKAGIKRSRILYLNFEDERLDFEAGYDRILDAYLELYPDQTPEEFKKEALLGQSFLNQNSIRSY